MADYDADRELEDKVLIEDQEIDDSMEEDSAELPSFEIGLVPAGDKGSSFRTQNDPSAPYQRSNYVERNNSAIDIRCSCLDVIHGLMSAESEKFATLVILQFQFNTRKRARRVQSVNISLEFGGMNPGESGPEVFAIAPVGNLSLVPTVHQVSVTTSGTVSVGGGGPVTTSGSVGWSKSITGDKTDHTTVMGSIDLIGRNYGPSNCASWTLLENATAKTGVPNSMRTAILLKRKDMNQFKCVVKINASVDIMSTLGKVFGGKGKDDPVLFDPEMDPTNKLQKYDVDELGSFNLESVCDVTFGTVLEAVTKSKSFGS